MNRMIFATLLGLATLTNVASAQQADQPSAVYPLDCERGCLLEVMKQYMDALRTRSPSAAPVSGDLVFTENNVVIPHGKGLWTTVEKVDAIGLEAADVQTGNAAWFGSVVENGKPLIYAVRIHVRNRRIDEVESVVHRLADLPTPFGDTTKLVHDKEFNEVLPAARRRPRERLRAIADAYFDTVELNDGLVFAPFSDDCARTENALKTASVAQPKRRTSDFVGGCEAQFRMGYFRINKRVRERTYPIIDEERGVVIATGFFDHANEWDRFLLTDGKEMKTWLKWPNTITLLEAFRIDDAKIQRVEAVFTYVPYSMHNPWAGPASAPPVPVSSPQQCDAACLSKLAGDVMKAYAVRGTWKALPWAARVGYEENSVGMQVNEGTWGSTTAVDARPLIVADAQLGRSLWLGRIEEHGQPAWGAVTLSADGNRIGRIDALFRRKEYRGPYAEPKSAPSFATLSESQRTPRATMVAAVDRYHGAVESQARIAPTELASGCELAINGLAVAPCARPFTQATRQNLEKVRDRQLIAVDEVQGLVAVRAYEDYAATVQDFTDSDGQPFKDTVPFPRTLQVVELFRLENGKITRIEQYNAELIYGTRPR